MKKYLSLFMLLISILTLFSCGKKNNNSDDAFDISILMTGYVNLGTDKNDPYREWIKDNYNLDITLHATNDFLGQAIIAFASNNKPDIVVFDNVNEFNIIAEQNVLLEDWTPYLASMPNVERIINGSASDTDGIAKQLMTDDEGRLRGIWTIPDAPTWSLKIREDWAIEYRSSTVAGSNYPAGNVATDGGPWQPNTPEDLLNFARWIKANKPGAYGFTSAGGGNSLGTLGNWLPLMWGTVAELPYGVYINEKGEVDFPVTDGTHELMLKYLKTICDEGLIDPNWYVQSWAQKTKTQQGLIGIEWYPGAISTETESYNDAHDGRTVNWWKTYDLPVGVGYEKTGGFMPVEGYLGKVITVSKKAALNPKKMGAITTFLNDVMVYYDEEAGQYQRPEAYDALRWGVGVEDGLEFQTIADTDYVYLNTKSTGNKPYYRETTAGAGAWDWGAWISTTYDGVIQGNTETIDKITEKVIEHNEKTANMKQTIQIGSMLIEVDATKIAEMKAKQINYEYNFVTGERVDTYEVFRNKWFNDWGGKTLFQSFETVFSKYGLMDK